MSGAVKPRRTGTWSDSAVRVLQERYLLPGESPEDMCWRVASAIAQAERCWGTGDDHVREWAARFYDVMVDALFLPNSPTLMNAGTDNTLQYSACYVLPVDEEGAFETLRRASHIHRSGAGTGFSFSRLRPKGGEGRDRRAGPVLYMRVFDAETEVVKQEGVRRGANMGVLRVDHPDIIEFIECKLNGGLSNFNISVAVTTEFMDAYYDDRDFDLIEPTTNGPTGNRVSARAVLAKIVGAAWRTGDPGLIFLDRMNESPANPAPVLGAIEAANPCGEQPLYNNEACNLGSVNLSKFLKQTSSSNLRDRVDWNALERVVRTAVRFLDNVIETNPYPYPEIAETTCAFRRVGLGVMGWADLLFRLGVPYDDDRAIGLASQIMSFISDKGHQESVELARQRGPFPNWERSIYSDGPEMRNATVTTVAPTGSISIIAGCSSGIEPAFALAYTHAVGEGTLSFVNPEFEQAAREGGFHSSDLMEAVKQHGTLAEIEGVPTSTKKVFKTAHELTPEAHILMQAAFQRHTDNAVSKTVNLPNNTTTADVAKAFLFAYEQGCLGTTVYREGSKSEQVLHAGLSNTGGEKSDGTQVAGIRLAKSEAKPVVSWEGPYRGVRSDEVSLLHRPAQLAAISYRKTTPLGTAFLTITETKDHQPFEVFVNVGKAGSERTAAAEAMGRLVSLVLRLKDKGTPRSRLRLIEEQLRGIGGARSIGFGPGRISSLPDGIARVLAEYLGDKTSTAEIVQTPLFGIGDICPDCGHPSLISSEGCRKCFSCGYSDC